MTRPIVSALMFTSRFGWIVPDADTMASRSRATTVSAVTTFASLCRKVQSMKTRVNSQ